MLFIWSKLPKPVVRLFVCHPYTHSVNVLTGLLMSGRALVNYFKKTVSAEQCFTVLREHKGGNFRLRQSLHKEPASAMPSAPASKISNLPYAPDEDHMPADGDLPGFFSAPRAAPLPLSANGSTRKRGYTDLSQMDPVDRKVRRREQQNRSKRRQNERAAVAAETEANNRRGAVDLAVAGAAASAAAGAVAAQLAAMGKTKGKRSTRKPKGAAKQKR
jgi:hypothetical protein